MSKNIKSAVIVYRPSAPEAKKMALKTAEFLKAKKILCYSHPKQKINGVKAFSPSKQKVDIAIALGGDGTYLEAVHLTEKARTPILGINLGSLGFLSDVRKEDCELALTHALKGKLQKRPRSMLKVDVKRGTKIIGSHVCLNDAVLERGSVSQLINIALYSENHLIHEVKADGLVISTPTGSTAYNLAAGGPILHPTVRAFVVTPICPHALTNRPIIFPDDKALSFKLINKKHKAFLNIDGRKKEELRPGDQVIIKRDKCDHLVLRQPKHNYFDLLRTKLAFGVRD